MVSRLFTWLFYAVIFFLIGVWVGGFSPGVRALTRQGAEATSAGFERLRQWADKTITEAPSNTPAPPVDTDFVAAARAAFARGDVSKAIAFYQDRLRQKPADVDARGELGNVLLSAGRLQESAQTFAETARRLAVVGDRERARALIPAIRRSDEGLADRLEGEIKTLGGAKPPDGRSGPT